MSTEGDPSSIGETAKAVAEIVKAVPIYTDAVQPAAKEASKGLLVVAKAVNAALSPLEAMIWGVDKIKEFVRSRVAEKLKDVPAEEIQQPGAHIAVPAIEALRYTGSEPELSELYANLLATSMDKATAYRAHPGFVDMIKNMSPDEARLMKFLATAGSQAMINIKCTGKNGRTYHITHRHITCAGVKAGCAHSSLTSNYLDNLERLGLIEFPPLVHLAADELYKEIEDHPQIKGILEDLKKNDNYTVEVEKLKFDVTDLGKQFIRACVVEKSSQPRS